MAAPPTGSPATPPRMAPARAAATACFVAIVTWLSVVIGIGVISVVSRPWCTPGTPCEASFWPRLALAAAGGVIGFLVCGYGLLTAWRHRALLPLAIAGLAVTVGTGIWFLPILTA